MKRSTKFLCTLMAAFTLATGTLAPKTISIGGKEFTTSIAIEANAAAKTGQYQVNTKSGVNVRKGAGTNYDKVDAAANGTKFKVSKVSGNWGYTSSIKCNNGTKAGWVCLDYCKYLGNPDPDPDPKVKYSFQKAYNYAKKYWNTRNPQYNYYNGRNCANFVSQCLVAAGIPTNNKWKNGSDAFINCTYLKNYFTGKYASVTYKANPAVANIKKGDVIYTNNGGHVMFVMNVSNGTVYASANTNNRDCARVGIGAICGVLKTSALLK